MNIRTACLCLILSFFNLTGGHAAEDEDTMVITAQEIQAMQALKISDLLNNVPGVRAGDSSVSIHGSYKVKVFVDGRPINDPTSSHGRVNWDLVSPEKVERIEILRGKGGLQYGQDAAGGVILITTRHISRLNGNIKGYGGSQGTRYGQANLQTVSGKLGFSITGSTETTDGYKINNDKKRQQAGAKLAYTLDDQKGLSFSADFLEKDKGSGGLPEYPTPFSRKSIRNSIFSVQARYNPLTSTTFFNQGRNHNTDSSRGLDQKLKVSELGEDLTATMATGDWGALDFGGGYRLGKASGSSFEDRKEETFSFFASQSLKSSRFPFSLSFGLRGSFYSAFDDTLNPEIKASCKRSFYRLTASYSRTNNTPSFYQRFNRTSSTRPNPGLSMETAGNYGLALFIEPYDSLSGSVSLFYNRLRDRITYLTGSGGIGQYQNFGEVIYRGSDLAVTLQPRGEIKIKGSYTYLEARVEETGMWLPAKARHQAGADFYWRPYNPFSLVACCRYTSSVFRNKANTKTVPGYLIGDIRAEYDFKGFSLFGELNNILDKTYYYADGLLAPPRTWLVGANWRI